MRIVLLAQCITEHCLEIRDNHRYLSAAGRKKVMNLASYLAELGHHVDIVSSSYAKGRFPVLVEQFGERITLHHCPTWALGKHTPFRRVIAARFAQRWLAQHDSQIDLVIIYNYHVEFALPALWARSRRGLPFVLDYEDGLYLSKYYRSSLMYRWIERAIYRRCAAVISVNQGLLERMRELGVDRPAEVIHGYFNAADVSSLVAAPGTRQEILFSGNFSRGFGFEELLQYIDNCPEGWLVNICGRSGAEETEAIRQHCSAHPRAKFHGFVSEATLDEMRQSACAVLLLNDVDSIFNRTNFPSKLFDYMSAGKIIVCTANPLLADYAGLGCMLQLASIPDEFPRLGKLLQHKRFEPAEVIELHVKILGKLRRLLSAAMESGQRQV